MAVAIVGAGVAGAGVAHALDGHGVTVSVFEETDAVAGRTATRRRRGCRYDYGANYVTDGDPRVTDLVTETLPTDGLVDVTEPVYTFDADGEVSEGDGRERRKWTYRGGIAELPRRLLGATDATVHTGTRVTDLVRRGNRWQLHGVDDLGTFDRVVLTPPAPKTAHLLRTAEWSTPDRGTVLAGVGSVPYRTVFSTVLHYDRELDRPWYALLNADHDHAVGWLSREECKPGHVPAGESLLVVQMGPDWSARHLDADPEAATAEAAERVAALLDDDRLADPGWTDAHGWRYALADAAVDDDAREAAREADLHFAGDWVAGEARVHAALRSGLDLGERLQDGS